jgi:type I restriction enzyme S subunit
LVLERRFPEFQDAGVWDRVSLGSVATISTKKVGEETCIPMSITSGVGLVSQMEKFGRIIAGDSYKNYLLLQKNDFAYNKSATKEFPEGFIALYTGEELAAVPNSIFTCFRVEENALCPRYLNYLFLGNLHGRWLRKFIEVGGRAHGSLSINDRDLLALPVPIPGGPGSLQEQEKIADCLTSADALIEAQGQKVEALRGHKNGLMLQLFPREGEKQPRLRFHEFEGTGEWQMKSIGQLGAVVTGSTPSTARPDYYDGDRMFVSPADISDRRFIEKTKTTLTALGFKETRPVPPNSVLFVCIGSTIGKVAQNRLECATNQQINAVIPKANNVSAFVYYALSYKAAEISSLAGIQAVPIVNKSLFSSVELLGPKPQEQQRIADCLASLDDCIDTETQKLSTFTTHKKGLLQQLFPAMVDE